MKTWKHTALGGHVDLLTGFPFESERYSKNPVDIRLLRGDNITPGSLRWEDARFWNSTDASGLERYALNSGDIVIAMDRTWIKAGLKCAVIQETDLPCLLVQRVARLRGTNGLDTRFLGHLIRTHRFEQYVQSVQTETAVPHISSQQICEFPVVLPPLEEQEEISKRIDSWDRAISLTERLIAAKLTLRKGLMQQLLTGKRRFPGFSDPWRHARLDEVFERVTRAAAKEDGAPEPLSITAGTGFVLQREKFSRVIAGNNLERYVLLRHGEFSYNKGNSKRFPQGCIYRLNDLSAGLVPNVFYSFRASSNDVHPEFYEHFFESGGLNHALSRIINTGVRNDGLLNLNADAFFAVPIPLPPVEEQKHIAKLLRASQDELSLLRSQLAALKTQKRGLMQQLLTGKVRVQVADAAA